MGTKVEGECEEKGAKSKLWETTALKEWTVNSANEMKIMARKVMSWKLLEGRAVSQSALCPQDLHIKSIKEMCSISELMSRCFKKEAVVNSS